jgi:hypothetical protein
LSFILGTIARERRVVFLDQRTPSGRAVIELQFQFIFFNMTCVVRRREILLFRATYFVGAKLEFKFVASVDHLHRNWRKVVEHCGQMIP